MLLFGRYTWNPFVSSLPMIRHSSDCGASEFLPGSRRQPENDDVTQIWRGLLQHFVRRCTSLVGARRAAIQNLRRIVDSVAAKEERYVTHEDHRPRHVQHSPVHSFWIAVSCLIARFAGLACDTGRLAEEVDFSILTSSIGTQDQNVSSEASFEKRQKNVRISWLLGPCSWQRTHDSNFFCGQQS